MTDTIFLKKVFHFFHVLDHFKHFKKNIGYRQIGVKRPIQYWQIGVKIPIQVLLAGAQ